MKKILVRWSAVLISLSLIFSFEAASIAAPTSKPTPKPTSKPVNPKPENTNKPKSDSSATKVESNNSAGKEIKATKSTNNKVNPSTTNSAKINANAQKVLSVTSKSSASCQAKTPAEKARLAKDPCSDFIVVFVPGLGKTKSQELLKQSNAQVKREFNSIFNGALVNAPLSKMVALNNNPNILVIEDDLEVNSTAIQSSAPWGLDRIDQSSLPLSATFDDQDLAGSNTYSFVVDTGIDASNLEFEGRIASGFTAVNDGLGSKDCNGHGTHVAGIIGGKTFGVAKNTNLVPVRVLDCNGSGSYSSVISGLDWIAANYTSGMSAVVNMSLGGAASSTIDGAVATLIAKGINVVVAAGNSNADACNFSPARVTDAITVGATDRLDYRATYSNYGSCLDLFAPGTLITSTWLGSSGTNTISGTSMATPHVTGIVARFISANATLTPAQVANSIKSSTIKNLIVGAGTGSLNQLAYLYVTPNLVTESPTASTPLFKKVTPRGKKR